MARKSIRLPKRFPVGTKYVIEGTSNAEGALEVSRRYVLLPNGRKVDLLAEAGGQRKTGSSILPKSVRDLQSRSRAQRAAARAAV
jgi:hypothetical protein